MHDFIPVGIPHGDYRFAEDTLGVAADVALSDSKVHLPIHVTWEANRIGRVSLNQLILLAVAQTNICRWGNDPKDRMLRLMGEQSAGHFRRALDEISAFSHVCRGRWGIEVPTLPCSAVLLGSDCPRRPPSRFSPSTLRAVAF